MPSARVRYRTVLAAVLTLVLLHAAAPVWAQEADAAALADRYTRHGGIRDRFYLNIGGVFLRHDTVSRLATEVDIIEGSVDFEKDVGLPKASTSFRVEGYFKLFPRHRFRFSYFRTWRSGTEVLLDTEIEWGDLIFPINVSVDSMWNTTVTRLDYRFSVLHKERFDLGVNVGIFRLSAESEIGLTGNTNVRRNESQTAPLPMGGLDIEWYPAPKWLVRGGFQYFAIALGDETKFDGNWSEWRAVVEYYPWQKFGFGVGYLFNDVNLEIDFDTGTIREWDFNYLTGGVMVYVAGSF